jgi:hypothetical protein
MVIAKKEQKKNLFQNPFKLMFNIYYSKSNVCFNIVVGFEIEKPKFN